MRRRRRDSRPGRLEGAAGERQALVNAYGTELGGKIHPRGFYDIFWTQHGPIAFRDDGSNPDSYREWTGHLNDSGLPFTDVRRGLCGWLFPKFITALIAVDPDVSEMRRLAVSGPSGFPLRR